jgi:hypothetical protein
MLTKDRGELVGDEGYLDAALWSRAVPIEWRFVTAYVVANDVSNAVDASRTVANQVFQTPAIDRYYTIADLKTLVAWKQLIDHDTASRPVGCAGKCDCTVRGRAPPGNKNPAEGSHDHYGDKQRNPCPTGQT